MNKAELCKQVEAMTEDEAADAPDWPDKITPMGSGETATGEPLPDVAAAVRRSRRSH